MPKGSKHLKKTYLDDFLHHQASLIKSRVGLTENPQTDSKPILFLNKGDRIILFTDGLAEIENNTNQEYGKKRLEEFIFNNPSLSPKAFSQGLLNEIRSFKEGDFKDDIFLVNIMIKS